MIRGWKSLVLALCNAACTDGSAVCGDERCHFTEREWRLLQAMAEIPPPPPDLSNRHADDPRAARLGQKIYYDRGFSGFSELVDGVGRPVPSGRAPKHEHIEVSCGTCHDLHAGGADSSSDPSPISIGAGWFSFNAPSVLNAVYQPLYFWNGRADTIWNVVIIAFEGRVAMGSNRLRIGWRIHELYRAEYEEVFGPMPRGFYEGTYPRNGLQGGKNDCYRTDNTTRPSDRFDCELTEAEKIEATRVMVNASKAVGAYLRTLLSKDSDFDRFARGELELSDSAIRGARLFVGRAACVECHRGPLLSDNEFYNTGVPQNAPGVPRDSECTADNPACDCQTTRSTDPKDPQPKLCPVHGLYEGLSRLARAPEFRTDSSTYSDNPRASPKAWEVELREDMKGAFRTSGLRDVALTAPYMHNGSIATLEDVVWFYDRGGTGSGAEPERKNKRMRPLGLDSRDVADLVAFMHTLSGDDLDSSLLGAEVCGDGGVTEACDDGNYVGGDGCSTRCEIEAGYLCTGAPSRCER